MSITWNTGLAAERARHNLKLKNKKRPPARKLQASSRKPKASSRLKNNTKVFKTLQDAIDYNESKRSS